MHLIKLRLWAILFVNWQILRIYPKMRGDEPYRANAIPLSKPVRIIDSFCQCFPRYEALVYNLYERFHFASKRFNALAFRAFPLKTVGPCSVSSFRYSGQPFACPLCFLSRFWKSNYAFPSLWLAFGITTTQLPPLAGPTRSTNPAFLRPSIFF